MARGVTVNEKNLFGYIMEFEGGTLNKDEVISLFSYLIKTGQVWRLQGFYGRTANDFIEAGLISRTGVVDWDKVDEAFDREHYYEEDEIEEAPPTPLKRVKQKTMVGTKPLKVGRGKGWWGEQVRHKQARLLGIKRMR